MHVYDLSFDGFSLIIICLNFDAVLVEWVLQKGLDIERNLLPLLIGDQVFGNEDFIDEGGVDDAFGLELDSGSEAVHEWTGDLESINVFIGDFELDEMDLDELVVFHCFWYLEKMFINSNYLKVLLITFLFSLSAHLIFITFNKKPKEAQKYL